MKDVTIITDRILGALFAPIFVVAFTLYAGWENLGRGERMVMGHCARSSKEWRAAAGA